MTCIEQGYIHGIISTSLVAISLVLWEAISRYFKSIISAVNLLLRERDDSWRSKCLIDPFCAETENLFLSCFKVTAVTFSCCCLPLKENKILIKSYICKTNIITTSIINMVILKIHIYMWKWKCFSIQNYDFITLIVFLLGLVDKVNIGQSNCLISTRN